MELVCVCRVKSVRCDIDVYLTALNVRFFCKHSFDIVEQHCRDLTNGLRLKYHRQAQQYLLVRLDGV
jgi:hypothetical protein